MPQFGVKYAGLHKRDSYEGLIDYLENKQEKLKLPDREAKFVRDSPQYQALLNEGFLEVEGQQLKQINGHAHKPHSQNNNTTRPNRTVTISWALFMPAKGPETQHQCNLSS